ncbi:hypothetical protein [Allomesorhizobium camelthorni]|uniref:Uncharacterized protein n=1 Tax=Allomesorhizobium camelthorni TaxID=475069 RepID=A0A6G4W6W1_9HYPH|nr:hypothetical protein [Mesorhizobium camelthorni]NGO50495.1 hypothetical protein [Mesorhizobium camelthorni]
MRTYFRRGKGPRFRLPDDIASAEFQAAYQAAAEGKPLPHIRFMPVTPVDRRKQGTEAVLRGAFRSARTRGRQKDVAFDLDLDFLLEMAVKQDFRCALTGIEFLTERPGDSRVNPYTPSIDRIRPKLGYTKGNVRLVIYAVNAMLLDWGEELFRQIANSHRYWPGTKTGRATPAPKMAVRGKVEKT